MVPPLGTTNSRCDGTLTFRERPLVTQPGVIPLPSPTTSPQLAPRVWGGCTLFDNIFLSVQSLESKALVFEDHFTQARATSAVCL